MDFVISASVGGGGKFRAAQLRGTASSVCVLLVGENAKHPCFPLCCRDTGAALISPGETRDAARGRDAPDTEGVFPALHIPRAAGSGNDPLEAWAGVGAAGWECH